jgi:hypothetical protein
VFKGVIGGGGDDETGFLTVGFKYDNGIIGLLSNI